MPWRTWKPHQHHQHAYCNVPTKKRGSLLNIPILRYSNTGMSCDSMSSSNLGKRRRSRCYFMKARGSIGKLKGWRDKLINKNLSNDGFRKLFVSNMFPLQWKTGRNLLISPPINRFGPTQNYLNLACWTKSPKTRSIPTIHFEGTIHNIKSGRPCTLKLFLLEESQTRKPLSLLTILICKSKKIFCNLTQFPVFQFGDLVSPLFHETHQFHPMLMGTSMFRNPNV